MPSLTPRALLQCGKKTEREMAHQVINALIILVALLLKFNFRKLYAQCLISNNKQIPSLQKEYSKSFVGHVKGRPKVTIRPKGKEHLDSCP